MLFLIKLFPEITMKIRAVRRRFTRQLRKSLCRALSKLDSQIRVQNDWYFIEVEIEGSEWAKLLRTKERLSNIPGVVQTDLHER